MAGGRPAVDVNLRFGQKVLVKDNGCHEWTARVSRDGYGRFYYRGKQAPAHRVSFLLNIGDIPEGMCVCHSCDNKTCVNPEHLFLGTIQDNIKDMDSKARRGTKSRLTYKDANEIRSLVSEGMSQQEVANMYGIDQTTVSKIKIGQTNLFRKEK